MMHLLWAVLALLVLAPAAPAQTPAPRTGDWVVRDFAFESGDILAELRLHYTTLGDPSGIPVLLLHGIGGAGPNLLFDTFGGELFGPGQPLDAGRYYIILPDAIGTGSSSKPSDGLRTAFPRYTYADIVRAQYRLVTEHLRIRHLRLVLGFSAGGMQTWLWGGMYPDFVDALVPMSALPAPIGGRHWIMHRMVIDAIRGDPGWREGAYTEQPRGLAPALVYFNLLATGGTHAIYAAAPTRAGADAIVEQRMALVDDPDANDVLYQFEAAGSYDPVPGLGRIQAPLLAITSADDERNPFELGLLEREIQRVKGARFFIIPASGETRGHNTVFFARFWKDELAAFLRTLP